MSSVFFMVNNASNNACVSVIANEKKEVCKPHERKPRRMWEMNMHAAKNARLNYAWILS